MTGLLTRLLGPALLALALLAAPFPAAAADGTSCSGTLAERLGCWADRVGAQDASVLVTLNRPLELEGKAADWKLSQRKAAFDRGPLVLMVPAGHPTGAGGTLLLVLAGDRLVDPGAEITRLDDRTLGALREAGACPGKLCETVAAAGHKDKALRGKALLDAGLAAELGRNSDSVGGSGGSGGSSLLVPALGVAALLLLLVTALVFAVRRSQGPRLAFAVPAPGGPAAASTSRTGAAGAPGRHRSAPGRDAGRPSAPGRVAVVRTALHPQGYVELDQCLHRAVWAEPGTPAPAPGTTVEVSEGRGKDAGILYAHAYAGS
ncbi:hypothetical protein [Streptomyces sp. NPDC023838]|uniref:hypothetical protein n=1 Tax=Streptomyces sp. NPDC023838 TaxID=3154325 RepID=UPI0034087578